MAVNDYDFVVLDIEGTITPITFVKDTLFPYVLESLSSFLDRMWCNDDLHEYINLLREQAIIDVHSNLPHAVLIPDKLDESSPQEDKEENKKQIEEAVRLNITWQMEINRKIGALKQFQGFMWKEGYAAGVLQGELFDDVLPALDRWHQAGKRIYIYSSGSVDAQKLLVKHSIKGDLQKYFSGYFDTNVGLKTVPGSYEKIAQELAANPPQILFVSDNINEIVCADKVGYQVIISDRPGNAKLGPESTKYKIVTSFDQIQRQFVASSPFPCPVFCVASFCMFSTSALDLPTHIDSAELGYGKSLAFDAASTSAIGFVKHSLSVILDNQDSKQIFYFLLLNLSYMFVQLAYGVWTNSLGLISDAIHMFFDCLALGVGLFASVMSKWPSNQKYSYGYNRIETLAAYFNGVFLILISISIVMEAIQRLIHPPEMNTQRLLLVSFVGLLVNLIGIFAFNHGHAHGGHSHGHDHDHGHHHGHGHSANMQGVFLHIMADTLGSVGVIVSTLLIQWFEWTGFDPIASLFIAVLIVLSVIPLVKQAAQVLMLELDENVTDQVEGTLDILAHTHGIVQVEVPRFWPYEAESVVGSLHVKVRDGINLQDMRRQVTEILMKNIDGLKEVCVQVEHLSASRFHAPETKKGFFQTHAPDTTLSSTFIPSQVNYRTHASLTGPVAATGIAIGDSSSVYARPASPHPTTLAKQAKKE